MKEEKQTTVYDITDNVCTQSRKVESLKENGYYAENNEQKSDKIKK
jgi:hypothetical protein